MNKNLAGYWVGKRWWFRTAEELRTRLKARWYDETPVGERVGVKCPQDEEMILEMLKKHPRAEQLLPGAVGIVIGQGQGDTRNFQVLYGDGRTEPFSIDKCIWVKRKDPVTAHKAEVIQAMREELRAQADVVRLHSPLVEMDVHHVNGAEFSKILEEFLRMKFPAGTPWMDIKVRDDRCLEDRDLAAEWFTFHAEKAKLVAVSPEDHLKDHHKKAHVKPREPKPIVMKDQTDCGALVDELFGDPAPKPERTLAEELDDLL